jgi:hypothetical protein
MFFSGTACIWPVFLRVQLKSGFPNLYTSGATILFLFSYCKLQVNNFILNNFHTSDSKLCMDIYARYIVAILPLSSLNDWDMKIHCKMY